MTALKIAFFAYRKWAFHLLRQLKHFDDWEISSVYSTQQHEDSEGINFEEINPKDLNSYIQILKRKGVSIALFYGWSWFVPKEFLEAFKCICLHPSPLPKYRGGSPMQHQIIQGEKQSAVTLFFMTEGMDDGDIIEQQSFSLEGDLTAIFSCISDVGALLTARMLNRFARGDFKAKKQDESKATVFKRRKPSESELKPEDFKNHSAEEIHNLVRSLGDPYPNAFIVCKDGKKLFFVKTKLQE